MPPTSLLKRRLWGIAGAAIMLGMVVGMILLFDSSDARDGQEPISPWVLS